MYTLVSYERLVHKSGELILDNFHSCTFEKLSEVLQYIKHLTELSRKIKTKQYIAICLTK